MSLTAHKFCLDVTGLEAQKATTTVSKYSACRILATLRVIFKLAPIQDTSCFGFWSGVLSWYAQTGILKHLQLAFPNLQLVRCVWQSMLPKHVSVNP